MNKILLIIKREYLVRVKKKSFIIMTLLGPLLFAGLMIGAVFVALSDSTQHNVLIVDPAGYLIKQEVADYKASGLERPRFKDTEDLTYEFTTITPTEEEFKNSHHSLWVQLDSVSYGDGMCEFYVKKLPSLEVQNRIQEELEASLEQWRVKKFGMDWKTYQSVKQGVTLNTHNVEKPDSGEHLREMAGVGFGFSLIIYMFIFIYGVQVMRGVIEEKTNRIIEVIISSVKPFQLMMGKIIGIGLVGLTQFVLWVVFSGIAVVVIGMVMGTSAEVPGNLNGEMIANPGVGGSMSLIENSEPVSFLLNVPWMQLIFAFLFYFIGGFLLYASLFAAIGAAVDQDTDTQQFMPFVTIPLVFGFIVSEFLWQNPEGTTGTIFGILPLTSPVVMMVKTAMGWNSSNVWELIVSMLLLIGAFVGTVWVAGRIYRVGILMYGKKATYKELWKWVRYKG
ncbi:MAG: ABC transporter permease [Flavobacteriales bacterium]